MVKNHSPVTLLLYFTESLKRDNIQEGSRRTYKAGNTLECVCVSVCVRVRVCVGVRKLPVFFTTVKHTSCVCVGVQKCSALRCVRKQHVAF